MINLKALSRQELESFIQEESLPRFRVAQLIHWIYRKKAGDIDEITEFSKSSRATLKEVAYISNLILLKKQLSSDGTVKYLFELDDRKRIESVLISDEKRLTLCISSQVGCAMGCKFCLTGTMGLKRNLTAHEIVDQIIAVSREIDPEKLTNIVFMGMGEPLMNFNEMVQALWRITDFMGFSKRRITLSTCGIAPKIVELYQKAPEVNLAVSLNATVDVERSEIMPVNKKYPLSLVLATCRKIPLSPRRRITFEYVMLKGINDTDEDARRLSKLLRGIPSKVNLIPFNDYKGTTFHSPDEKSILTFQKILTNKKITAMIRKSKGDDILAACGQLSNSH